MTEYTDRKNRKHKVIESVRNSGGEKQTEKQRIQAEREITEALLRIFQPKEADR